MFMLLLGSCGCCFRFGWFAVILLLIVLVALLGLHLLVFNVDG